MKSPKIGLCIALFLLTGPTSPNAVTISSPPLPLIVTESSGSTLEKYAQVLDLVFPMDWCDRTPGDHFSKKQIIVRVLPSFWQESQIVVCRWTDGRTLLVHSTLPDSDGTVWTPVIEESMGNRKPASVQAIAATFHPLHHVCKADPAVIADWFKQLRSMRFDVPNGGGMDGFFYEITLRTGMNEMHAKVWGPDKDVLLIPWVDRVRQAIAKMSCKETAYSQARVFQPQLMPIPHKIPGK